MPKRPGGLTAICVISIILASLGLLSSIGGVVGLLMQDTIKKNLQAQKKFTPATANSEPVFGESAEDKFQAEVAAVEAKWRWAHLIGIPISLLAEILLLVGAVKGMTASPGNRNLFRAGLGIALLVDSVNSVPAILMNREMSEVFTRHFSAIGGPNAGQVAGMMEIATTVGFAITLAWLGIKVIFYGIGISYLSSAATAKMYAEGFPSTGMPQPWGQPQQPWTGQPQQPWAGQPQQPWAGQPQQPWAGQPQQPWTGQQPPKPPQQ